MHRVGVDSSEGFKVAVATTTSKGSNILSRVTLRRNLGWSNACMGKTSMRYIASPLVPIHMKVNRRRKWISELMTLHPILMSAGKRFSPHARKTTISADNDKQNRTAIFEGSLDLTFLTSV